jgi:hypothetical protein
MLAHHIHLYLLFNKRAYTTTQLTAQEEYARGAIMNTPPESTEDHHEPGWYEIRIKGYLDNRWNNWFEGLTMTRENNGETSLTGQVTDQAALHGLLRKVRDLGLPLISVNRIEPHQPEGDDVKP